MRNLMIMSILAILFCGVLFAETAEVMTYQTILVDENGERWADGTYSIQFNLYDCREGGESFWNEVQEVTISDGGLRVELGSVNPLANIPDVKYVWLGISINGGVELTPRKVLWIAGVN